MSRSSRRAVARVRRQPLVCNRLGRATADVVAVEEPLELRVEGRAIAVIMRTPGHDEELAAGFLLTEGVVAGPGELFEVTHCRSAEPAARAGNIVDALLRRPGAAPDFARLTRHVFTASSCGLCGKATIDEVHRCFPPLRGRFRFDPAALHPLTERLAEAQASFRDTGGVHAAAVFDAEGRLLVVREDVGRHNAVDKVLGHALLAGLLPLDRHGLLVSGRVSFEIVQKALAARIPVVAGISAPTSLAVDFARRSGQTLVGFLRGDRANVYAGSARLRPAPRRP